MARVCDISSFPIDKIADNMTFAVDTNVLYYMHYTKATTYEKVSEYQSLYYPRFINALLDKDVKLVTTIHNVMELLYIIEDTEFDIYKEINGTADLSKKNYREIISERNIIKTELDTAFLQIKNIYGILNFEIEVLKIDEFIDCFSMHKCDNYDYLIIEYLKSKGYNNFITDDRDFLSIDGVNVYTANKRAVSFAAANRILIK